MKTKRSGHLLREVSSLNNLQLHLKLQLLFQEEVLEEDPDPDQEEVEEDQEQLRFLNKNITITITITIKI
jgi:hypothetical protein